MVKIKSPYVRSALWVAGIGLGLVVGESAYATAISVGTVASTISTSLDPIAKLIRGGGYVAGLGFAVGAIMKFKMHKDNPQSTPIGTPVALIFIAAALVFLPSALSTSGKTLGYTAQGSPAGSV